MFGDIFPIETLTTAIHLRIRKNGGQIRKRKSGHIEIRMPGQRWCSLEKAMLAMLAHEVWGHKVRADEMDVAKAVIEMGKAIRASLGMEAA